MSLKNWSTTAGSNATVDSINFAENQAPSTVNDSARALMADVRTWYEDVEWRDWGHTVAYASAATFTIATDLTAIYTANRPIRCTDATTLYGRIVSSSYGAPNTTVTVILDSGSLSASLTAVSLGSKFKTVSVSNGISSQSGTASYATNVAFTDATATRTITIPDSTGTVDLINAAQTVSAVKTHTASLWMAKGADVASASDCNIWTTDGNTIHLTGTTTVTDWGTAPQAGAWKWVICDAATPLTYHATTNKLSTGGTDYTTTAGDVLHVYADSTSSYIVTIHRIGGLTSGAVVATTSGSTVTISSSIPAWVNRITILPNVVSTTGNDIVLIQIGDSGGLEATNYFNAVARLLNADSDINVSGSSIGFPLTQVAAASNAYSGRIVLCLQDPATNTWNAEGSVYYASTAMTKVVGYKSLSGTLTTVSLVASGGGTFDAGSVRLLYE